MCFYDLLNNNILYLTHFIQKGKNEKFQLKSGKLL